MRQLKIVVVTARNDSWLFTNSSRSTTAHQTLNAIILARYNTMFSGIRAILNHSSLGRVTIPLLSKHLKISQECSTSVMLRSVAAKDSRRIDSDLALG